MNHIGALLVLSPNGLGLDIKTIPQALQKCELNEVCDIVLTQTFSTIVLDALMFSNHMTRELVKLCQVFSGDVIVFCGKGQEAIFTQPGFSKRPMVITNSINFMAAFPS